MTNDELTSIIVKSLETEPEAWMIVMRHRKTQCYIRTTDPGITWDNPDAVVIGYYWIYPGFWNWRRMKRNEY